MDTGDVRVESKRPTLGIDVDGVCAQFNDGFARVLMDLSRVRFPIDDPEWPTKWDWWRGEVSQETVKLAWEKVDDPSSSFWAELEPYPGVEDAFDRLNSSHQRVYFLTTRQGVAAKYWTELWLSSCGIEKPTVLCTGVWEKIQAAVVLGCEVVIDDYPPILHQYVHETRFERSRIKRVYGVRRPYGEREMEGVTMVKELKVMLDLEGIDGHEDVPRGRDEGYERGKARLQGL